MNVPYIVRTVVILCTALIPFSESARSEPKLYAAPDIIPPATAEMQTAGYWISRIPDPDRVIMTPAQIQAFNEKNRTRSLVFTDIDGGAVDYTSLGRRWYQGLQFHRSDPLAILSVNGDSLKAALRPGIEYVMKRDLYDRRHILFSDAMKEEVAATADIDAVPDVVRPRYGIVCTHALNRRVPSSLEAYSSQFDWLDMFQTGAYETGTPVAILHRSVNGDWSYVQAPFSYRWVPSEHIAEGTAGEIRALANPDKFIVALAHKVPVYGDDSFNVWMTDIYQGAKLGLIEASNRGYRVVVPRRGSDGSVTAATGWVKPDGDVSVGYQPFTQRNVIETMFRLLNHAYGWGDCCHERDCCGIIRTVMNTFGIETPRAPIHQFYYTDHAVTFSKDMTNNEKYRLFEGCEPGITICGFNGHIMMYLGAVGNDHFVIHSNGYSYHDANGDEFRVARTAVTDLELEGGSDLRQFTNISVYKP